MKMSAHVREQAQGVAVPSTQTCQADGTSVGRNLEGSRKRKRPKVKESKVQLGNLTLEPKLAQRWVKLQE